MKSLEEQAPRKIFEALLSGDLDYRQERSRSTPAKGSPSVANAKTTEEEKSAARELLETLSEREMAILSGLIEGKSSNQIGAELFEDRRDAARQFRALLRRLNARSAADAVRVGFYGGITE